MHEVVRQTQQHPAPRPTPGSPAAPSPPPALHAAADGADAPQHAALGSSARPETLRVDAASDRVSRLAHELRNLLDGSMRNLNILLGSAPPPPPQPGAPALQTLAQFDARLRSVKTALEQMAGLVERTLRTDTSSTTALRRMRPPTADLTIREACEHALAILQPLVSRAAAVVELQIDAEAARLPADAAYTIVTNGVRNALESILRASPPPGSANDATVRVRVAIDRSAHTPQVVLEISDTGPGLLPPDNNASVSAHPHARPSVPSATSIPSADAQTPAHSHGSGIGLALCRELISEFAGTIRLLPGDNGRGALLRANWPLSRAGNTASAPAHVPQSPRSPAG